MGVINSSEMVHHHVDFFHLGLILVVIMLFITGIVLCVAVAGVCCFHWLDVEEESGGGNARRRRRNKSTPTPAQIREEIWRLDSELSQQMRRYQQVQVHEQRIKNTHHPPHPSPPSYDLLFPFGSSITLPTFPQQQEHHRYQVSSTTEINLTTPNPTISTTTTSSDDLPDSSKPTPPPSHWRDNFTLLV